MQSLEDLGYFCVDNLPPALLPSFIDFLCESHKKNVITGFKNKDDQMSKDIYYVALVVDVRGKGFFPPFVSSLTKLAEDDRIEYRLLYLEANDAVLIQRYKTTRRTHPLTMDGSLVSGITAERHMLAEVKSLAHQIIDTSLFGSGDLKQAIFSYFIREGQRTFSFMFISFGFKYGLPMDADLVFDVRFLPNPYYVESLRPRTGRDAEVHDHVFKSDITVKFVYYLQELLLFLLPQYKEEGKQQLMIAIGCTGGRHRSVAIIEYLVSYFNERKNICYSIHRDIRKDG